MSISSEVIENYGESILIGTTAAKGFLSPINKNESKVGIKLAPGINSDNLCSCLSSHITFAFSLAVPSRQPRHSIFLGMRSPPSAAALLLLRPPFAATSAPLNIQTFRTFLKVDSFPGCCPHMR